MEAQRRCLTSTATSARKDMGWYGILTFQPYHGMIWDMKIVSHTSVGWGIMNDIGLPHWKCRQNQSLSTVNLPYRVSLYKDSWLIGCGFARNLEL